MELVKFTLNHWDAGDGYPDCEPYSTWMDDYHLAEYLGNDAWCRENGLAVVLGNVDMSCDFCVIAPKEWVEKNCPEIIGSKFEAPADELTNDYYTPYAPNYEDYIGCYFYNDDLDMENKCHNNPYIINIERADDPTAERIPVKNILDKSKARYQAEMRQKAEKQPAI